MGNNCGIMCLCLVTCRKRVKCFSALGIAGCRISIAKYNLPHFCSARRFDCTVALGAFDVATRRISMSSRVIVRTISCLSLASCALASNPSHIDVQLGYSTHNTMPVFYKVESNP